MSHTTWYLANDGGADISCWRADEWGDLHPVDLGHADAHLPEVWALLRLLAGDPDTVAALGVELGSLAAADAAVQAIQALARDELAGGTADA